MTYTHITSSGNNDWATKINRTVCHLQSSPKFIKTLKQTFFIAYVVFDILTTFIVIKYFRLEEQNLLITPLIDNFSLSYAFGIILMLKLAAYFLFTKYVIEKIGKNRFTLGISLFVVIICYLVVITNTLMIISCLLNQGSF
jgi:hypothetical protein